ncbi:MAG: hypothetical protein KF723_22535, partial [Rhizobiaceae bacterium]|nr:hypothetical protein [Rhizobiaceae bacterium]
MTLGSHQSTIGKSQVHITPRFIVDATGPFDLDPCAADPRPWDCAAANITEAEDGLATAWQIANYFVCGRLCKCSCHYAAPAAGGTNPRPTSRRAVTAKANEDSPASAESVSGSAITAKGAAATEGPTAAPRGRGSSKTTAPESSGGSADVPSAAWLNQRTTAISRRGENTSPAGAGSALGSTRPTVCDSDVLIPEKQSGSETPTAATQDPIGVARPNESAPGWTTSGDVVIKSGSPSTGCRRIGHLVSDG